MRRIESLVFGLDHPEGVAWDPELGCVWARGEAGHVYRVELEERTWAEVARAPGVALGLAVDGRGRVVAANLGRWHLTLLDLGPRGAPLHRPDRWAMDA